ncbi:hypothetical protein Lal_00017457 [Lupinus albus]|nr:hypothetical protein Lal_00017457 [Lupinus albus]
MDRYGGRQCGNPFEELKDLSQTGNVEEYVSDFEYISSQVDRLPEEQYLGYFLGGLRPEIRLKVRTLNPVNRLQAMRLARDVEAELNAGNVGRIGGTGGTRMWKGSRDTYSGSTLDRGGVGSGQNGERAGNGSGSYPFSTRNSYGPIMSKGGPTKTPSAQNETRSAHASSSSTRHSGQEGRRFQERSRGTKHIPYTELMNRKAQGLCFRCGEKYHPLHQCAEKQLRLIVLGDDEAINEEGEIIAIEVGEEEEEATFDLSSMGLFGEMETQQQRGMLPATLRVEGTVNGVSVLVLVDSGASHNFVAPKVVEALGLVTDKGRTVDVRLGDGHRVATKGKCKNFELQLGEFRTKIEFTSVYQHY